MRTPAKLDDASWRGKVEVVAGSVGDDLTEVLRGIDVAVYLVHSIGQGSDWARTEESDAVNFSRCARLASGWVESSTSAAWGGIATPSASTCAAGTMSGQALASTGVEGSSCVRGW